MKEAPEKDIGFSLIFAIEENCKNKYNEAVYSDPCSPQPHIEL